MTIETVAVVATIAGMFLSGRVADWLINTSFRNRGHWWAAVPILLIATVTPPLVAVSLIEAWGWVVGGPLSVVVLVGWSILGRVVAGLKADLDDVRKVGV